MTPHPLPKREGAVSASASLSRRRHRDFYRGPGQHLFVECIQVRIGLAPAAIRKAEVGVAEHAYQPDLRDIEWPRQHILVRVEARHAVPRAIPVIVGPGLPALRLRP